MKRSPELLRTWLLGGLMFAGMALATGEGDPGVSFGLVLLVNLLGIALAVAAYALFALGCSHPRPLLLLRPRSRWSVSRRRP